MAARVLKLPARPAPALSDDEVLGALGLGAAVLTELLVDEWGEQDRPLVEILVAKTASWVAAEDVPVDEGLLVVESVVRSLLEPLPPAPPPVRHLHLVPPLS
jgi:hypothetical protein